MAGGIPSGFAAGLTERGSGGIHSAVKVILLRCFIALSAWACGMVHGQEAGAVEMPEVPPQAAPADVVASAVNAVQELGEEVVMGRFHVAVERMYPGWKEREAKRAGGMAELEKRLEGVTRQMIQQGISIILFRPEGRPRSYEVMPGRKVETVAGQEVESLIYTKWMVLVPTLTKFRIMREGEPKPLVIESIGYQVAVSDKDKLEWTFIDGSGLTMNDLRSLFISPPLDLELPPVEKREAR
jgi:hypothetical protein